jgi:hypothetical protein
MSSKPSKSVTKEVEVVEKEKSSGPTKILSKTISKLKFMKRGVTDDTKLEDSPSNTEYWVNPKYSGIKTVEKNIVIEEKDPFLLKMETNGRKSYGKSMEKTDSKAITTEKNDLKDRKRGRFWDVRDDGRSKMKKYDDDEFEK